MPYPHSHRMLVLFGSLAIAAPPAPGAAVSPTAQYVAVEWCTVQYQPADNMWAPFSKPDGNLGIENIQVQANGKQDFNTDWAFERMRNDGVRGWYGSHLRVATNTGTRQVELWIKNQFRAQWVSLQPGQTQLFQDDLSMVYCK